MPPPPPPKLTSGKASAAARADEGASPLVIAGRYRVVDQLGVGGMASVLLARADGPGGFQKWIAIKRIHPHLVTDDQFVDMFLDEARIAAGINHANVAQVFDLGRDGETYWIAMEYLHGEPLRDLVARLDRLAERVPPAIAARICADAAEGLHAAHELHGKNGQLLGLVHRDVSPHNLFVTYDGYTKVVDFGVAKVADRLSTTGAGTLKGKLAYMSPEQVRGAEVDRTTDVFALGVVLWELTTGQRLFRTATDLGTLERVEACVVPRPSSIIPDYPPVLEEIVLRALARSRNDRFATAREFSRALQATLVYDGALVGHEEVARYVQALFADRIEKREAQLAWAAEITSTVNGDALRARPSLPGAPVPRASIAAAPPLEARPRNELDFEDAPTEPGTESSAIRGVGRGMATSSLLDDEEEIPTRVATEAEQLARVGLFDDENEDEIPTRVATEAEALAPAAFRSDQPSAPLQARPVIAVGDPDMPALEPPPVPATLVAGPHVPLSPGEEPPRLPSVELRDPPSVSSVPPLRLVTRSARPLPLIAPRLPPIERVMPQSQIKTELSLPRPASAEAWVALDRGSEERSNKGLVLGVVLFVLACAVSIGVLLRLKAQSAPSGGPAVVHELPPQSSPAPSGATP